MTTLHKLFAGILLVTLTAFGLTALTSSSNDPATTPVFGFTDKYCQNEDYKWFKNVGALIAADGKTDPDATGKDKDKIWRYYSYIEDVDPWWPCHRLEYRDVKVIGEQPKKQKPITGGGSGGGGGGEETQPPKTQEPPPEKTPAELQADNFTEEKSDKLRECLEEDLDDVSEDIEGWNSDAIGATEATWETSQQKTSALGNTGWKIGEDKKGNPTLSIFATIFPQGIGIAVGAMFAEQKDVQVAAFEQLAQFSQAHELFHVGQIKRIFDATGALPKPYEYWDLEVQAHNGATRLWKGIHGENAEPPSVLNLGTQQNYWRKIAYDGKKASYEKYEEELADPKTTEARKKVIKKEMDKLAEYLKSSYNLPEANRNGDWKPGDIDIDCDE